MDNLDKYIDNLFEEKLSGASIPGAISGANWTNIGKVLQKKAFLKFSLTKFNIYYLSTLIVATTIAGAIFLPPLLIPERLEQPSVDHQIEAIDSIAIINNEIVVEYPVEMCPDNVEVKKQLLIVPNSDMIEKVILVEKPIFNQEPQGQKIELNRLVKDNKDTAFFHSNQPGNIATSVQDTIVVVDTVRIKKTRRLLRRDK